MSSPPKIDNAPGLKWRKIKAGWQAIWRARSDLVKRGYHFRSMRMWASTAAQPEPSIYDQLFISQQCQELQNDMLVWAAGGITELGTYDSTWGGLVRCYKTDPDSAYHKKRYTTRNHYDTLCRRIENDHGKVRIADTDARQLMRMHEQWSGNGTKIAMGHAMVGMLRTITTFGATLLKCPACKAIRSDLHDMRVPAAKPREHHVAADQATALRRAAHAAINPTRHSIALAQALQFDLTLRQKDVIGEWVPLDEPTPPTDIISGNSKWVRGIRCEEIDQNLILRHMTSKRDKMLVVDLKLAPMVIEELRFLAGLSATDRLERGHIPTAGPLVVNEQTGIPWTADAFRLVWRTLARSCGIPDHVRNMDSRAGAITEAFASGAQPDDIRKSATHSNQSMTQRYSRGDESATADVMQHRAAHRNKKGT